MFLKFLKSLIFSKKLYHLFYYNLEPACIIFDALRNLAGGWGKGVTKYVAVSYLGEGVQNDEKLR